ncbi:Deoxyuridine 5 -triphosphate nucleotidohydrolase [Micractinium conductrix]|uniref:Deoxyuridine 5'-triphosphate nucleotidohydrolase n=1 Tax=Micractinium conductrix TaxID=554055 RepID=A0A2P6VJ24_9CHLO|nr:Deoxyuridine 5 -triphosphate nucleotidohydrolase [Micractinium conductrix]|eukprot:PSC74089.1 Deoxyuridine 5 -triphosphate nucleotidohydrolase [Micractinium conductrix]
MSSSTLAATGRENVPAGAEPATKVARTEGPGSSPAGELLRVRRLNEHALLPKRGSAGAAGYDLASCEDTEVPARGRAVVKTGLQIAIPPGTYARVAARSGLAVKHFIDTGAGVVDEDYRGEVGVVLFNHSDAPFPVKRGDRIAQLILERIATPQVAEVESLDDTQRGAGGYGSTGVAS